MERILAKIGLLALAATVPVTASAQAALEGEWRNPKGSVVVKVAPCGSSWCGTVVDASAKAKRSARKGGTDPLIGTRILSNLRPAGNDRFKGHVFDPKRNIRAPATIKVIGPNAIEVRGCAIAGILLCKEQRWTRVS
jgi:uncharacterized protein (DUF2147 family)